jgi:hypothetical protein
MSKSNIIKKLLAMPRSLLIARCLRIIEEVDKMKGTLWVRFTHARITFYLKLYEKMKCL